MSAKIIFVLSMSAVFGASLATSPEELKYLFKDIAETIRSKQVTTFYLVKENEAVIKNLSEIAKETIKNNLTTTGQPYWDKIESFEKDAETSGANITECVNDGNKRFDTLTEAAVEEPLYKISLLEGQGSDAIDDSLSEADKVLKDLSSLEEKVNACSDEGCAASLEAEAETLLSDGVARLEKSVKKSYEFAQVTLEPLLQNITVASSIYEKAYNAILDDIATCIRVQ